MPNNVIEGIISGTISEPIRATSGALNVADVAVHPGEDSTLDRQKTLPSGPYVQLSASGQIKASAGALVGMYVSQMTSTGTLRIMDGSTTAIGTVTGPAQGWHWLLTEFSTNISAVLSGTPAQITFIKV